MQILTKKQVLKNVPKRWRKEFCPFGKWHTPERKEIYERLSAYGDDLTEADTHRIIGNSCWTELKCDECEKLQEQLIEFKPQETRPYLCKACLEKALTMLDDKTAKLEKEDLSNTFSILEGPPYYEPKIIWWGKEKQKMKIEISNNFGNNYILVDGSDKHLYKKTLEITGANDVSPEKGIFEVKDCSVKFRCGKESKIWQFPALEKGKEQAQLQERVNTVRNWIKTLAYKTTFEIH